MEYSISQALIWDKFLTTCQLSSGMVNLFRLKQENRFLEDQGIDGDQFNFHTLEKTYSCAGTTKIKAKNSFSL